MLKKNDYKTNKEVTTIFINNKCGDFECLVDTKNFEIVRKYRWYIKFGYAFAKLNYKEFSMHHLLFGKKDGLITDHINRNKLDNRLCNLRFVTKSQNGMNRNSKGYYWNRTLRKFEAQIRINNKKIFLGNFENKEDAIKARIMAEKKYYGEYAINRNDTTYSP